jgi:hypothetical protein
VVDDAGQSIVRAFRRVAVPLGWYYAITLVLPLANGAWRTSAAFFAHAAVVLIVPPAFIVLIGAAGAVARTCRLSIDRVRTTGRQSSSAGGPAARVTSSGLTRSMLNLPADALILSMTSSKSKLVAFEKRIGLIRATTNDRR